MEQQCFILLNEVSYGSQFGLTKDQIFNDDAQPYQHKKKNKRKLPKLLQI